METFIVYKITCLINKKIYIGYTKRSIDKRFKSHIESSKKLKTKLYNAFKKYGINNFIIEEIHRFHDKKEALNKEIELISEYNTIVDGYNMTVGGEGGPITNGKPLTEEHKSNISKKLLGRALSEETKKKISNILKQKFKENPEMRKNLSEKLNGRVFTEEHKNKISKNHHNVSGKNNPFYGKKHTDESKSKIGNREYIRGEKHHLYGKPTKTSFKEGKDHPRSQQITIDGIEYGSLTQASKLLGLSRGVIKKKYLS